MARVDEGTPTWDAIVRAHDQRVLVLLLSMGLRVDLAKEVAQATWLRLLEQQRAGRLDRLEFPGIALKQARFLGLDALRQERREVPEQALTEIDRPFENPERQLASRESLLIVARALEACSPASQRIFRAVYEEPGEPHSMVAARLGLSVQRVRQALWEVRARLRKALEDQGGGR